MHEENEAVVRQAMQDIASLERLQARFAEELTTAPPLNQDIGTLTASKQRIDCKTIGFSVRAEPRIVRVGGRLSAVEYRFEHGTAERTVPILTLFLHASGTLTTDAPGTNRFADFNNTYIRKLLVIAIAAALVKSPVCAASEA